jgi:hypothetical protein
LVVCNVRPAGERANPWPANLRADPRCLVRLGRVRREYLAREVRRQELDRWWDPLVRQWPAYAEHFRATGQRGLRAGTDRHLRNRPPRNVGDPVAADRAGLTWQDH